VYVAASFRSEEVRRTDEASVRHHRHVLGSAAQGRPTIGGRRAATRGRPFSSAGAERRQNQTDKLPGTGGRVADKMRQRVDDRHGVGHRQSAYKVQLKYKYPNLPKTNELSHCRRSPILQPKPLW